MDLTNLSSYNVKTVGWEINFTFQIWTLLIFAWTFVIVFWTCLIFKWTYVIFCVYNSIYYKDLQGLKI